MDNQLFTSEAALQDWLDKVQKGYGAYARSLWVFGIRSTGEFCGLGDAQLQTSGLTVPAAAHLRHVVSQGVKNYLAANAGPELSEAAALVALLHVRCWQLSPRNR